jgi:hypothetical protein
MQENNNTGKQLPVQDTGSKENITINKPAVPLHTTMESKLQKTEVAEKVKESFRDEDVPAEPAFGNDGFEVGGEGG